jgi:fatty acid desaturase
MEFHSEELDLARAYEQRMSFEGLSKDQMKLIMDRGRELYHWFKNHQGIHSLINLAVLLFIFSADYLILMRLPRFFIPAGAGSASTLRMILAALVIGSLHSWLMYSLIVFSMHEGAAHKIVFPHDDPVSKVLNNVARNLCRLAAGEPYYYSEHHMSHHAKFGTEQDGEFLNYVTPRRYWLTLLPYANIFNYSDFVVHRPPHYTRSRVVSAFVGLAYNAGYGYFMARSYGWKFAIISIALFVPHVGFYLDRLRQYTEHNLMPLDNKDGSRSFGLGFWGMLIGGGPWGSPCHWEHHLVASLPWYQQLQLHRFVVRVLTPRQRQQYLLQPVIGYPKLLWRLWREPARFRRQLSNSRMTSSAGSTAAFD